MNSKNKIKFIDFCAGIGGGRTAAESLGLECIGYSEIEKSAIEGYTIMYGTEKNYGDLMKIDINSLPDFDLMIAGFPCQTFSIAGLRKGLNDERGQIIFGLLEILKNKDIKYFLFENVKGLLSIDNGKTLKNILSELKNLGYNVNYNLLNTKDFGLPHSRERIYIYGEKSDTLSNINKEIKVIKFSNTIIKNYLIDDDEKYIFNDNANGWNTFIKYINNDINGGKFNLNELLKEDFLILDTRQSDLRLYRGYVPTLRKGRHGLLYIRDGKIRKISGFEGMLLQGFDIEKSRLISKNFPFTKLLGLVGNSMSVNVIKEILSLYITNK